MALQKGYVWAHETEVEKIWSVDDSADVSENSTDSSDLHRLSSLYKKVVSSTHGSECKRRFLALLFHHECRRHRVAIGKKGKEEIKRSTGMSFSSAQDLQQTAWAWLKFVDGRGLGGLLIAGPGQRSM